MTADRTYFSGLDLELTAVMGGEIYAGFYYSGDLWRHGRNPFGFYIGAGARYGLNLGASVTGGYVNGPFSNFSGDNASLNFGLGPVSASIPLTGSPTDALSGGISPKGWGLGLDVGISGGMGSTATFPITIPDKLGEATLGN